MRSNWLSDHVELIVASVVVGVLIAMALVMLDDSRSACINGYSFAANPYTYEFTQILDDHGNGIRCQEK